MMAVAAEFWQPIERGGVLAFLPARAPACLNTKKLFFP
jgi:hypothetical protein